MGRQKDRHKIFRATTTLLLTLLVIKSKRARENKKGMESLNGKVFIHATKYSKNHTKIVLGREFYAKIYGPSIRLTNS